MKELAIIEEFVKLPTGKQKDVLVILNNIHTEINFDILFSRKKLFDNKQIGCPHCKSSKYVKYGIDKGSQRYKCKDCGKSFTEFTGTWMANIKKKDLLLLYFKEIENESSLDKITKLLSISKQTAFDWRHKILSSIQDSDKDDFKGITESDETFFLRSEKGCKSLNRKARKRGGKSKKTGINREYVAVIVTKDRLSQVDITVSNLGRIKKDDISYAIGERVNANTIMCTDGHLSYKSFALANNIEHHVIRADLKEFVKNKKFHIQHINSTHSHLKNWIDKKFWGVSTKYLQKYMNWFRAKELLKGSTNFLEEFIKLTVVDDKAYCRYRNTTYDFYKLLQLYTLD